MGRVISDINLVLEGRWMLCACVRKGNVQIREEGEASLLELE